MKKSLRGFYFMLAFVFILTTLWVGVPATTASANNTTYYVDSASGNDSNNGTSTGTAWKSLSKVNATTFGPGDRILFKAGGSWIGQLHPLGSGASGSPIVIDMYGTGNKPVINGNKGVTNALYLYNQEYWEINNLEIINDDNTGADANSGSYRGIYVVAENLSDGVASHIYVKNCYVHHVDGQNGDRDDYSGGIIFEVKGTSISTRFDDVLIDGNTVSYVDWTGIGTQSTWQGVGGRSNKPAWNGSTNFVITNNYVDSPTGDGICPKFLNNPKVEYNYCQYSMDRNYGGSYAAAIWPWYCENSEFRYNEACFTKTVRDGMAYDCDGGSNNTLYEFNYSHDNEGGAILMAGAGSDFNHNPTFRYNISQNDGYAFITMYGGSETYGENIYNNTIYVAAGKSQAFVSNTSPGWGWPHNVYIKNNIYYNAGSGGGILSGSNSDFTGISGLVIDHNCFYGSISSSITNLDSNKVTSNPMLENPGSGGTHINMRDPNELSGYKLQSDSPCINAGTSISNNGGRDFWGTTLYNGSPDIGACEFTDTTSPTTIVNDNTTGASNNQFNYNGSWGSGSDSAAYNSDNHYCNTTNNYYTLAFSGTQIKVYGPKSNLNGIAAISIDNGAEQNVDFYSASTQNYAVLYTSPVLSQGQHTLKVRVTGTKNSSSSNYYISADRVDIISNSGGSVELMENPGFEADGATQTPTGWSEWQITSTSYTETYGGAHGGTYHGSHYSSSAYEIATYQTKTGLASGTYKMTAWVKSTGGQNTAHMYIKNFGGTEINYSINSSISSWTQITIDNINVTSGTAELGFYSNDSGNHYIFFDDVSFVKK